MTGPIELMLLKLPRRAQTRTIARRSSDFDNWIYDNAKLHSTQWLSEVSHPWARPTPPPMQAFIRLLQRIRGVPPGGGSQ
jgi:hypothetical protein